jgi:hypothetical protein
MTIRSAATAARTAVNGRLRSDGPAGPAGDACPFADDFRPMAFILPRYRLELKSANLMNLGRPDRNPMNGPDAGITDRTAAPLVETTVV